MAFVDEIKVSMSEVGAVFDVVPWLKQRAVFGVGAATVAKLSSYGVTPVMSGAKAHGKALADRIQSTKIKGKLLIPGQKTSTLTKHLRDISGQVYPLPLYKDTLAPKKLHYTVMAYASQAPGADSAVVFTKDTTISSIGYGSFDGYFPKGTAVYWRVYESSYIGSSTVPCKTYTSDAVAEFPRPVAK
jgi:hypothetical protein